MKIQMQHRVEAAAVLLGTPLTSVAGDCPPMCCGVSDDGDRLRAAMGGAFACLRASLTYLRSWGSILSPLQLTGRSAAQSPDVSLPVDLGLRCANRARGPLFWEVV